mmetsp:Transcript_26991/g.46849  ORF Transcript_26991/g.46849 Transcript_26991/m.46849 type:complete len:203 (-) Transcript_26991:367-975(-)
MFLSTCPMKSCTSSRSLAARCSSSWYCCRTSVMKVALCAEIVCDAVRKCSRTSLTTLPTVWRICVTEVLASCSILPTSERKRSNCAASAFPSLSSSTEACNLAKEPSSPATLASSPATFASPVCEPHNSSVKALCFNSRPAIRTSVSLLAVLILRLWSSMRVSKSSLCDSWESNSRFSSMAVRSTLRCRWCRTDSFCSKLYR